MNKILVFIFSLSLLFISCKKKLSFKIDGQLIDASFNKNLSNANIIITQVNSDGSIKNNPIYEGKSDSDGKFKVTINRDKALKYIVKVSKENYFEIENEVNFSDLTSEYPNLLFYQLFAKSWIKFKINNVFPANNNDVLTLSFIDKNPICNQCCTENKYYFNGIIKEDFICTFNGNQKYKFNYISSSPFIQVDFNVQTIALDTVEYNIDY